MKIEGSCHCGQITFEAEAGHGISRVAFVYYPTDPVNVAWLRLAENVASPLGIALTAIPIHSAAEIEPALTAFARGRTAALS